MGLQQFLLTFLSAGAMFFGIYYFENLMKKVYKMTVKKQLFNFHLENNSNFTSFFF